MKLRLPLYLLGCVLSLPLTMTASADTVGSGVFYDVGKIFFSSDPSATTPPESGVKTDVNYCWAAAGSNVMQYWQDTYISKADDQSKTPHTIIQGFEQPHGTDYLDIYNELLKNGKVDETADPEEFFKWWFKGDAVVSFYDYDIIPEQEGYYTKMEFGDGNIAVTSDWYGDLTDFTSFVKNAFATQGQAITLTVDGTSKETGESALYHVISCWGYELGEDGLISSLILSDSDDEYFGAFKVDVSPETKTIVVDIDYGWDIENVPNLSTEDQGCYYKNLDVFVQEGSYINTPGGSAVEPVPSEIPDNGLVMENTRIEKDSGQTVTGHGVTVGDDKTVVVLTSERGANLTLDGTGASAADTGLKVTAGAMVSLVGDKKEQEGSFVVENYANGGMKLTGKAYINDEKEVIISNNTKTGDGAGIDTDSYLEIRNNDNVTISGNEATGKGGGIYNTGTVSIRGNSGLVVFEDNTAADGGNDIYNAQGGIVNIADNGIVRFNGTDADEAAVVNDGVLYLQSGQVGEEGEEHPAEIIFNNSALDSTGGTTYVGQDVNGVKAETKVEFLDTATGAGLNIIQKEQAVAVLDHLRANASEIAGLDAEVSSMTNALVTTTGDLHLSSMTLDESNVFADGSEDVHTVLMDNVVITLNPAKMEFSDGKYNYDMSGMFDYTNMTLQNVYFDATGIGALAEGLKDGEYININFGLGDNVSALVNNVVVRFANDMVTTDYTSLVGGNVEFRGTGVVPEPATSTLSLLALAGLAARRRRK